MTLLQQPFQLPNGTIIKNRLAKSAMSEALATTNNHMTQNLIRLYQRWASGGIGLCTTGNVMIDSNALGEPNNLVIEDEDDSDLEMLTQWATIGSSHGAQIWMQLNHPGKQSPRWLNKETVSCSAVPFRKDMQNIFATPRELTIKEIEDIIKRFATSAFIAKKAGFNGVQIHGAHGYLVSQFLSPHHNRRNDAWGGSGEKRRRFMLEIVKAIRLKVGKEFPIGIKLNSADFQRGGFTQVESLDAICALEMAGIDLIEISGGTYEAPAMVGTKSKSTTEREAYFLDFAQKARSVVKTPLMVTGGFRTLKGMNEALSSGSVDFVGLARSLAIEPDLPHRLLNGLDPKEIIVPRTTGIKAIDRFGMLEITWYSRQLQRMGRGDSPQPNKSSWMTLFSNLIEGGWKMFRSRQLRAS